MRQLAVRISNMIEGKESGAMPHGNSGQWEKYTLDKFKKMWGKVAEGRS